MTKPELLSPIQDFTSLSAAIQAGCDAVYFGIRGFNMRAGAKNFTDKDLPKIADICHKNKVRCFIALNTIIYESELTKVETLLKKVKAANIDAVICWDLAVVKAAKRMKIETHLSTQASVSNSKAVELYKKMGIKRIVLARECSLDDIKRIKKKSKIEIETFIHGAMCVSESGRCFMSEFLHGKSANRGECMQPCRREYKITEVGFDQEENLTEGRGEFVIGTDYVLSPKDLCALPFIEKLIKANIDCFKIEGRNRSPEYVYTVTRVYRQAVDFYFKNKSSKKFKPEFEKLKKKLLKELKTVYNRGFSSGFYLGKPINEWCDSYGSKATTKKIHLGKITHFYSRIQVAEIKIEAKQALKVGDTIIIQGPTTGHYTQKIKSMEIDHKKITKAKQGDLIAIKLNNTVRTNNQIFIQK